MLRILNPFWAGEEFQKLKLEKKWLIAIIIVLVPTVLSAAGNGLISQKMQEPLQQYMEEMGTLTGAQLEAMQNMQGFIAVIGIVVGIFMSLGLWAVKSVIFHFLAGIFGGEKADISSTIHLIAYTYLPLIFKGFIDLYKGFVYQAPSYEEFMSQLQSPDTLLNFVRNNLNIFLIWSLILIGIAVRTQFNLSRKKAALVVLIPYVLAWILQAALASLSSQMLGGI